VRVIQRLRHRPRGLESSLPFLAWPESAPYQVAVTTYHEHRCEPCRDLCSVSTSKKDTAMPSPDPATQYQLFVGVDIAAATATVAWQGPKPKPSKPLTLEQTPEGFSSLHQRLINTGARPEQILIVMEATGIYWLAFATYFACQGYAGSRVNPSQAHHFPKALLRRARNRCYRCSNFDPVGGAPAARSLDATSIRLRGARATPQPTGAAMDGCAPHCIWRRSRPPATIRSFTRSMSAYGSLENR
jgi:hypothetical protein